MEEINKTQDIVKYNKHCYKLTDEDRKEIVLDYFLNRSKDNIDIICTRHNISKATLYNIVKNKNYKKEVNAYITENKRNLTKKFDILIDKAAKKINEKLEKGEDINLNQLSTTLGILYDKSRLEQNLSTSNNSINISIKVEK